jgi:hypothetical protein
MPHRVKKSKKHEGSRSRQSKKDRKDRKSKKDRKDRKKSKKSKKKTDPNPGKLSEQPRIGTPFQVWSGMAGMTMEGDHQKDLIIKSQKIMEECLQKGPERCKELGLQSLIQKKGNIAPDRIGNRDPTLKQIVEAKLQGIIETHDSCNSISPRMKSTKDVILTAVDVFEKLDNDSLILLHTEVSFLLCEKIRNTKNLKDTLKNLSKSSITKKILVAIQRIIDEHSGFYKL